MLAPRAFCRYVTGLRRFPELRVVHVGDVDTVRAKEAAAEYGLPAWGDDADLYADDDIDIGVMQVGPASPGMCDSFDGFATTHTSSIHGQR